MAKTLMSQLLPVPSTQESPLGPNRRSRGIEGTHGISYLPTITEQFDIFTTSIDVLVPLAAYQPKSCCLEFLSWPVAFRVIRGQFLNLSGLSVFTCPNRLHWQGCCSHVSFCNSCPDFLGVCGMDKDSLNLCVLGRKIKYRTGPVRELQFCQKQDAACEIKKPLLQVSALEPECHCWIWGASSAKSGSHW